MPSRPRGTGSQVTHIAGTVRWRDRAAPPISVGPGGYRRGSRTALAALSREQAGARHQGQTRRHRAGVPVPLNVGSGRHGRARGNRRSPAGRPITFDAADHRIAAKCCFGGHGALTLAGEAGGVHPGGDPAPVGHQRPVDRQWHRHRHRHRHRHWREAEPERSRELIQDCAATGVDARCGPNVAVRPADRRSPGGEGGGLPLLLAARKDEDRGHGAR